MWNIFWILDDMHASICQQKWQLNMSIGVVSSTQHVLVCLESKTTNNEPIANRPRIIGEVSSKPMNCLYTYMLPNTWERFRIRHMWKYLFRPKQSIGSIWYHVVFFPTHLCSYRLQAGCINVPRTLGKHKVFFAATRRTNHNRFIVG